MKFKLMSRQHRYDCSSDAEKSADKELEIIDLSSEEESMIRHGIQEWNQDNYWKTNIELYLEAFVDLPNFEELIKIGKKVAEVQKEQQEKRRKSAERRKENKKLQEEKRKEKLKEQRRKEYEKLKREFEEQEAVAKQSQVASDIVNYNE